MKNGRSFSAIVLTGTVLLFAAALLLLSGCRNVLQLQEPPPSQVETGTLSLTINGQGRGRVIVPETPTFVRYRLVFDRENADDSFTAIYPDGFPNPYLTGSLDGGFEITLPMGTTWSLNVFAYIRADDSEYSAHGLLSITMDSDSASGNIELGPIATGYGIFAWDITGIPDDVLDIFIRVYSSVDNIRVFETEASIIDGTISGSTTINYLAAGQYYVFLTARYEDGKTTVSEVMHVFRNMTSIWNWVFIPRGDALLDFVLNLWDTSTGTWGFLEAGITHEHFGHYGLGINGVREDNFGELVYWFDELTLFYENEIDNAPRNLIELKALIDATLIGMGGASIAAGNHTDVATAEAAIRLLAANVPESWELNDWVRIYWEGNMADVLVGDVYFVMMNDAMALSVTITFNGNAANVTGVPDPLTGLSGATAWVASPERDDYFFAGWNTSPDATGNRFMPEEGIVLGIEAITLYAIWSWFEFGLSGDDDTIVITGLVDTRTETDIVIPSVINGVLVTVIGSSVFSGNQLTSVDIPDGVTSIGAQAFSHNELTSVVIPDSVTYIGISAFSDNQLTSVVIPGGVTYIESAVFQNNQLTSVVILDGVIYIRELAFARNPLTSITIPDGVEIANPPDWDPFAHTMGVHGYEFFWDYIFYNDRQAGTYIWIPAEMRWVDVSTLADLVRVDDGTFQMGCLTTCCCTSPVRYVTASGFYMSRFQVTQGKWYDVMGTNPSYFHGRHSAIVAAGANWRNLPVDRECAQQCQTRKRPSVDGTAKVTVMES